MGKSKVKASLPVWPIEGDIRQGDSLELMREMADGSVDLVVTSPPYNLGQNRGGWAKGGTWDKATIQDGYPEHSDDMPHGEYVEWQRACLTEMMRLVSDKGAIFYNHKWRVQGGLLQDRSDIMDGFPVRQIIIWWRKGGINVNEGFFMPGYEVIYMICKPDFKLAKGACGMGDVWEVRPESNSPHPCPFPLDLARRCIASTTAKRILDPFCGSGTTLVAAGMEGRESIGLDNSAEYCEMARLRIAEAAKQGGMAI